MSEPPPTRRATMEYIRFRDAVAVSPSDTNADPAGPFDGFYTGAGGDITVTTAAGHQVTFSGTLAASFIWCVITQVWLTGTTGSNILGLIARTTK